MFSSFDKERQHSLLTDALPDEKQQPRSLSAVSLLGLCAVRRLPSVHTQLPNIYSVPDFGSRRVVSRRKAKVFWPKNEKSVP